MSKVCIVGAGITGISLGKLFPDHEIFEKSKGIGGRIAARRFGPHTLNHGPIDFFHPKINSPIINPHSWIKSYSENLNITREWEAFSLNLNQNEKLIADTLGRTKSFDLLFITAPAPQTKLLLERSNLPADFLDEVKYKSEIQLMIHSSLSLDMSKIEKYLTLSHQQQVSENEVLKLFTLKELYIPFFITKDKEEIREYFISQLIEPVINSHVHKWKYSEVTRSIPRKYQLEYVHKGIYLAGDYFEVSGIQGSLASVDFLRDHY